MGLFGFFITMVGLGGMTKDTIERNIFEAKSYDKAINNGDLTYYTGNGAERRSTKTGRKISVETDWETGHQWIVDSKTRKKIDNSTDILHKKITDKNKRIAHSNGIVFYRTAEFDTFNNKFNIYICDTIPGYFRMCHPINSNDEITYEKGEVEKKLGEYRVVANYNAETYFGDGTLVTQEEINKRRLSKTKEMAISWGEKFYCDISNQNGIIWYHVETDKPYVWNADKQYYAEAKLVGYNTMSKSKNGAHKTITRYRWEELEDGCKLNRDGTKWII